MKVTQGRITEIINNSGHYEPAAQQVNNLLQRLILYGVDLAGVTVIRFSDKRPFAATAVSQALPTWPDGLGGF